MEFLHALYEWGYEGNPDYLTKTHIIAICVLAGLSLFIFGYCVGKWHFESILSKNRKARRRRIELMKRVGTVEPAKRASIPRTDDRRERVEDAKTVKNPPQSKMPFPPKEMIKRVYKAVDTYEIIHNEQDRDMRRDPRGEQQPPTRE